MNISTQQRGTTFVISVGDRFTFKESAEFNAARNKGTMSSAEIIEVDFTETDYLDSAALGMLLVLRESAQSKHKVVELINARKTVAAIFDITNFKQLFTVRG